jgi:hypothetical protein
VRKDAVVADRRAQVRQAARAWRGARAIDDATRTAVEAAYPDDRARLGPAFRVLVFGFTVVAVTALFGLFGLSVSGAGERGGGILLVLFGILLAMATEVQLGRLRRTHGGTEAATAFLAVGYLLGGLLWLVIREGKLGERAGINLALALVGGLCAAAAYRWGYSVFAATAAVAAFLLAARGPYGRLLWIVGAAVFVPALLRAADRARLAPAHRRACRAVAAVALVALYVAVHLGSWESRLVEHIAGGNAGAPDGRLRVLAALATALLPVAVLVWGIASRRRLLINLGIVGLLASIVTLRFYVHAVPLWLALLAGGGVALALAVALRRYLEAGPEHERRGLTAEPLFTESGGRGALELAVNVAVVSPDARADAAPEFQPGGGRYGGGGATGKY